MSLQPRGFLNCLNSVEWKNEILTRLEYFSTNVLIDLHVNLAPFLLSEILPLVQRAINSVSVHLEGHSKEYYDLWIALFEILQYLPWSYCL